MMSFDMLDHCGAHTFVNHWTGHCANTFIGTPASGTPARGIAVVQEPVLGRALLPPQLRSCASTGCCGTSTKAVPCGEQGNRIVF